MRVVAFRHFPVEDLGLIEPVLKSRGIEFEYADLYRGHASVAAMDGTDGLIFMGGPMSVNDDLPWIATELRFIQDAVAAGKPVLGICLGSQLIAKALGAKVYRNAVKEIGWFDVHLTDSASSDTLFGGLPRIETVFHWHGETFDLPHGAETLAYSNACRNQAFRFASNVYGLQYHLEVTPEMIDDWCRQDANCGDVRELETPLDPHRNAPRLRELSRIVFDRWCNLLARPGA
jgi:GMP synthase-like glutamine amidotransferase